MVNSLNFEMIQAKLKSQGYFLFCSPETVEIAKLARTEYFSTFSESPLRSGGFTYRELHDGPPIRKKNISSANGVGESYAQVLQTTYYSQKTSQPGLAALFKLLVEARNQLTDKPKNYGDQPESEKYWNGRRIHHYPKGGSFMASHRDTYFPSVLGEHCFVQLLFLMSKKGEDFHQGGGFINDLNGKYIDLEEEGGFGTLVFFDGRIPHGVKDIDPLESFSFEARTGRLAAIANLYEYRGT